MMPAASRVSTGASRRIRSAQPPGFGTPGLPLDRDATTRALGFDITQQPVTSVQLSRGKAEAQLLFELGLLMQDLGRMASDLLLFYTQEFAFIELPDAFTTGSSIMPQKRNPDLFELVRGRSATALACLTEALSICAKLPSGYQRDLQLLKFPLFRGIDIGARTLDIMAAVLDALKFRPDRIRLDPSVHATEEAFALVVKEGIPFREAYQRVAARLPARTDRQMEVPNDGHHPAGCHRLAAARPGRIHPLDVCAAFAVGVHGVVHRARRGVALRLRSALDHRGRDELRASLRDPRHLA
jgi:argininosuccinate lyase